MKKILIGIVIGFALASTLAMAQQSTEKHGMMGRMMKGMMGEQKSDEASSSMPNMREMMARMSKMMDMCSQMMGSHTHQTDQQPSEKK